MPGLDEPCEANQYHGWHARLLLTNLMQLTGRSVLDVGLDVGLDDLQLGKALYDAPYVVCSHNTASDPILNYGNRSAQQLWELPWERFTQMPSRKTAEPITQEERNDLLARVTSNGFIDDYQGVRITANGNRFFIPQAVVWNLVDIHGDYRGQAAMFDQWEML